MRFLVNNVKAQAYAVAVFLSVLLGAGRACLAQEAVALQASWFKNDADEWVVRIQPANSDGSAIDEPMIQAGSRALRDPRLIQALDTETGESVPFEVRTRSRGAALLFVELAFPDLQRPRELSLTVRGLILQRGDGRRLAAEDTAIARVPRRGSSINRSLRRHHGSRNLSTGPTPVPSTRRALAGPLPTPPPFESAGPDSNPPDDPARPLPKFPFPPPLASSLDVVPRRLIVGNATAPRLADVERSLRGAFEACGYGEKNYYEVPGGFAMASRLEQMDEDGSLSADRWSDEVNPIREYSLRGYLAALFNARAGHYRVIVFIVTDTPFLQSETRVGSDEAAAWVRKGLNTLPRSIGSLPYTPEHECSALVYEFKKLADGKTRFVEPSEISARTHLQKTGMWSALQRGQR